jgi:protein TonB
MFEDSVFESAGRIHTRSSRWMVAMFFFNASILAAMILIPLIHPEALPRHCIPFLMEPPTVQPEQPVQVQPIKQTMQPLKADYDQFAAPRKIPPNILIPTGPEPKQNINVAYWPSSLSDPSKDLFNKPGIAVTHAEPKAPLRVSTTVEEGLLIQKILPIYPAIAKAAHIEGTVRLEHFRNYCRPSMQ